MTGVAAAGTSRWPGSHPYRKEPAMPGTVLDRHEWTAEQRRRMARLHRLITATIRRRLAELSR